MNDFFHYTAPVKKSEPELGGAFFTAICFLPSAPTVCKNYQIHLPVVAIVPGRLANSCNLLQGHFILLYKL